MLQGEHQSAAGCARPADSVGQPGREADAQPAVDVGRRPHSDGRQQTEQGRHCYQERC